MCATCDPQLLHSAEQFGGPIHQSAFGDLGDKVEFAGAPLQQATSGPADQDGRFEVDEQSESGRNAVGEGVIDGSCAACFVELCESFHLGCPPKCRLRGYTEIRPTGESFSSNLLARDEVNDRLIRGLGIATIKQIIEDKFRRISRPHSPLCRSS
jgi:hypothetical protein